MSRPRALGKEVWDLAREEIGKWEGAGKPPAPTPPQGKTEYKLVSVSDAVTAFNTNTRENGAS
jgi:hypothetical protein